MPLRATPIQHGGAVEAHINFTVLIFIAFIISSYIMITVVVIVYTYVCSSRRLSNHDHPISHIVWAFVIVVVVAV